MSRPFKLEGCWTAMTSPFSADGRVLDLNRWEAQLKFQAQGGVRGVVPCGTTGEAVDVGGEFGHRNRWLWLRKTGSRENG